LRLLVYGGNQHGERRRVGDWPDAIGPQVLQDTYGCSRWVASYGVGIIDEAPFLILRKIESSGQRDYPLTALFDPGRETWQHFGWNGAHLLWALFGGVEAPGIRLLTEPESYHSEVHLGKLIEEIRDLALPKPDDDAVVAANTWLDLWSGAVISPLPLVVTPDPNLTGFAERPDLQALGPMLNELPEALRCGRGWLFGGRASHAESLGIHLILDDSRSGSLTPEESEVILKIRGRGHALRRAIESLRADADSPLKTYLATPVLTSKGEGNDGLQVLEDVLLLKELQDRKEDTGVIRLSTYLAEAQELFERVNHRLRSEGPLNSQITEAARLLIDNEKLPLSPPETAFTLERVSALKTPKLRKVLRDRLYEPLARDFFVARGLYPADASEWMPEAVRAQVCERLVQREERGADIPAIYKRETVARSLYSPEELEGILDIAITRSAEFSGGLAAWREYFDDAEIGEQVRKAVCLKSRQRLPQANRATVVDYLLFGDDAGGNWLAEHREELKAEATLDQLVEEIVSTHQQGGEPALKAGEWLTMLAVSKLRSSVSVETKDEIAVLPLDGWSCYAMLRRAIKGSVGASERAVPAGPNETDFLAKEFIITADCITDNHIPFIPEIGTLYALLGANQSEILVDHLNRFEPSLVGREAVRWVEDWKELSEGVTGDRQRKLCERKYYDEFLRLVQNSEDKSFTLPDLREIEDEEWLRKLCQLLLYGGDQEKDDAYRLRLAQILRPGYANDYLLTAFRRAYEKALSQAASNEVFERRVLSHPEMASQIGYLLDKRAKDDLDRRIAKKRALDLERTKLEILKLLTLADSTGPELELFRQLQYRTAAADKKLFTEAIELAFTEIVGSADLKNAYLSAASSKAHIAFFKEHLSNEMRAALASLEADRKLVERVTTINTSILGGTARDDEKFKEGLKTILKKATDQNDAASVNEAVRQALSSPEGRETVFRRFVPYIKVKNEGERQDKISEQDSTLNLLFQQLTEDVSHEFLLGLWKHNESTWVESPNPLLKSARDVFRSLKEAHEAAALAKGKRKKAMGKKKVKPFEPKPFQAALLYFLGRNLSMKQQVGRWELGADQAGYMDDYLGSYAANQPDEEEAATGSKAGSIFRRVGRFLGIESDGNKSSKDEDEEEKERQ
jgi:hypothetical protein